MFGAVAQAKPLPVSLVTLILQGVYKEELQDSLAQCLYYITSTLNAVESSTMDMPLDNTATTSIRKRSLASPTTERISGEKRSRTLSASSRKQSIAIAR
jgi:hypothetical protein